MKQLLLVRHGKAENQNPGQKDIERALTREGHQDAPDMANRFIEKGILPELLISSTANRALTTAKHFGKVWDIGQGGLSTKDSIYEAGVTELLKVVTFLDNQYSRIALFGHNPGFTEFANYLSDADIYNIPPAGMVWIEFPFNDWAMISKGTGTLLLFDYPRQANE